MIRSRRSRHPVALLAALCLAVAATSCGVEASSAGGGPPSPDISVTDGSGGAGGTGSSEGGGSAPGTDSGPTSGSDPSSSEPNSPEPDEPTEEEAPYVDAVERSFTTAIGGAVAEVLTEEQVACFSPGVVRAIGLDTLEDRGVTAEDLATAPDVFGDLQLGRPQAEAVADALSDCGVSYRDLVLASQEDSEATDAELACAESVITEENAREAFVILFLDSDDEPAIATALAGCDED